MLWANYYGSVWKCWYKTANRSSPGGENSTAAQVRARSTSGHPLFALPAGTRSCTVKTLIARMRNSFFLSQSLGTICFYFVYIYTYIQLLLLLFFYAAAVVVGNHRNLMYYFIYYLWLMDRLLGLSVFLMGLTDVHNLFSCTFKLHLEDKISDLSIVANWAAWFSDDVPWKCVQIFTGPGGLILMHLMIP